MKSTFLITLLFIPYLLGSIYYNKTIYKFYYNSKFKMSKMSNIV